MKKYLAALAAIAVMTAAFTGCSGNNNSSSTADSSSSADSSTASGDNSGDTSSDTAEEVRTAKDITNAVFESIDWVASEERSKANFEEMFQMQFEDILSQKEESGESLSDDEKEELRKTEYDSEWEQYIEATKNMTGVDLNLVDDSSIYLPMMSVHLDELIVVKPAAGHEAEVEKGLSDHLDYIKNGAAFYPDQEIAAAGAVMGQTDDGFYYLVVHQIGSEIAEVIKSYKPGDTVTKLEVPENNDDGVAVVPTDEVGQGVVIIPPADPSVSLTAEAVMPGTLDAGFAN